jgi:pimeloyl-ACP methyl ester carboxylesterase
VSDIKASMKTYILLVFLGLSLQVSAEEALKTDTLSFVFEGKKFTGLLDMPSNKKPAGLIILVPGSGQTNMARNGYYKRLRRFFVENGLACYVWDKAGCGKSEGVYTDAQSLQNSADEAITAIEELKRLKIQGSNHIGLWGLSRGGWVCPLIIAGYPSIRFWISVSGPDDKENTPYLLETNFRIEGRNEAQTQLLVSEWKNGNDRLRKGDGFEAYQKATENLRKDSFWLAISGQQFTKEGFERTQKNVMKENYPYDAETGLRIYVPEFDQVLNKVNCPVLAIFGEKDSQVDWKKTTTLYRNTIGKNPGTTLTIRTFPNGNHNLFQCKTGGMKENFEEVEFCEGYFETMRQWLKENKLDQ